MNLIDNSFELMSSNTYTYGNARWVDQLTKFNGQTITYDAIGNPLSYYNGSSYTFTWNGRELATAVKGGVTTTYKYGADGLRTQKTVGSTVYNYYYADGRLVRQTWGSNYIDFLYDESGSAYSFIYNGTQYYYVRNLQGDVVKILNTSGGVVASYTYDAWGKVTSSGSIAQINPIRYRGYYYDTDTGFYYLQSRYYDPTIKRFISADTYINANGDLLGFNMYAYCGNNPINLMDNDGKSATVAFKTWLSGAWAVAVAEPTVFGEIIYGAGLVLFGIAAAIETAVVLDAVIDKTAQAIEKNQSEKKTRTYSVYFLADSKGKIQYVGRVTDDGYKARMSYHEITRGLTPAKRVKGLSYAEARGLEEIGMIECHTLNPSNPVNNRIHGISIRNRQGHIYMEAAIDYLLNRAENSLLNILK